MAAAATRPTTREHRLGLPATIALVVGGIVGTVMLLPSIPAYVLSRAVAQRRGV
jgi:hypothetical protein